MTRTRSTASSQRRCGSAHVSDVAARRFSDLSRADAQAIFDTFVGQHEARTVFTHGVSITGDIALGSERRITRLVAALEAEEGIERAVHEDRENILVRAPFLDEAGVEAIVKRLWTRRRKQTA